MRPAQVSSVFRAITPAEYDEAARRTPHLCPLLLAGDRRSGQQLLDDGAEGASGAMAALVAGRAGRAMLDTLAAAVEVWATEAELAQAGP